MARFLGLLILGVLLIMASQAQAQEFVLGELLVPFKVVGMFLVPAIVGAVGRSLLLPPKAVGLAGLSAALLYTLALAGIPQSRPLQVIPFCLLHGTIALLVSGLASEPVQPDEAS